MILGYLLCRATAPIMLTILPPDKYNAYADHFGANKVKSEKFTSPLPQYLSDRFGWPEMVEGFATRYNALPADVRARTAIFCGNYGEASAVNILGPKYGLRRALDHGPRASPLLLAAPSQAYLRGRMAGVQVLVLIQPTHSRKPRSCCPTGGFIKPLRAKRSRLEENRVV